MSATIAEDIRKFLQSVMRLEKASQKPILELLEKHFNNFKQELAQMQHGDTPVAEALPPPETKKGKTPAKKRKQDLRREKMIFHELLLPPVSRRKKGES
ncbi:MAG: hypothetical protein B6245_00900 [Desulfobacteraceae bacterium 4572_88]|nr:MAG: hypothetical protein B6245_00900 [Desulfobacteraceae bacterium 4572_88]